MLAEQVLKHRCAGAGRVDGLGDLRELLRVAEEHEVASGRAHGERVGERELARFVDEQIVERAVELRARKEPGGPRHEAGVVIEDVVDLGGVVDVGLGELG